LIYSSPDASKLLIKPIFSLLLTLFIFDKLIQLTFKFSSEISLNSFSRQSLTFSSHLSKFVNFQNDRLKFLNLRFPNNVLYN
jgi:transposase-like protein